MRVPLAIGVVGLGVMAGGIAIADEPATSISEAFQKGSPIFEFRPRVEVVDQANRPEEGEAFTARTRLGWQTAEWRKLKALIEFEDVRQLGGDKYDTNVNGKTTYGQVFDPDVTELNRLQLTWTPTDRLVATIGRQRMNIDDQRFIGGVAWRQDEQTFDAVRFDADFGRLDATYAYIGRVNRIFAEAQDWESDSHVATVSYSFSDAIKVGAFGYALDFTKPTTTATANQSSETYGLKASGKKWLGAWKVDYAASIAKQEPYGSSTLSYDLEYLSLDGSATLGPISGRLNYESMEGDGARGFSTPLATLHAFNGWSDAFIANGVKTTVDGLTDLNATAAWNPRWRWTYLFNLGFMVRRHEFEAERTGADLGSEWNAQAIGNFNPKLQWIVKYADYDGPDVAPAPADRSKFWIGLEWRL